MSRNALTGVTPGLWRNKRATQTGIHVTERAWLACDLQWAPAVNSSALTVIRRDPRLAVAVRKPHPRASRVVRNVAAGGGCTVFALRTVQNCPKSFWTAVRPEDSFGLSETVRNVFNRQHLAAPRGDLAGKFPNGSVPCLKPLALLSTARARFLTGTPGWAHESSKDHYWRGPLHHPNQFQQPNGTWRRFIATNACEETRVFKSHV